jgi:hypothetical protein
MAVHVAAGIVAAGVPGNKRKGIPVRIAVARVSYKTTPDKVRGSILMGGSPNIRYIRREIVAGLAYHSIKRRIPLEVSQMGIVGPGLLIA